MFIPNQKIAEELTRIIAKKDYAGAYLISGPEGVGKEEFVLNVVKEINEIKFTKEKIKQGFHPDVIFITPEIENKRGKKRAKDISIEQLKPGLKQAGYFNYQSPKKFFVVNQAEKMTQSAANSLLKIIEEPPRDCVFFLITAFEDRILDTVYSRCGKITLPLLEEKEIITFLENNFSNHSREDIVKIAEVSAGRYKTAEHLAGNKKALKEKEEEAEIFKTALRGGLNKAFDLALNYSKDKDKLLKAMDEWIYYLHNFAKDSMLKNRDIRIQKKVFLMTKELMDLKINIEKTNINSRLSLENYFIKFQ